MNLIALMLSSTFANEACDGAKRFQGFNLGIQAGISLDRTKLSGKADNFAPPSKSKSKIGGVFGAFVGYNHAFNNKFVLGANFEFNANTGSTSFYDTDYMDKEEKKDAEKKKIISFKRQFSFIPSVRFGYAVSNSLLIYLKAGLDVSRFKGTVYLGTKKASASKTKLAPQIGLGADYLFSKNVFARIEYTYSFPAKYKRNVEFFGINGFGKVSMSQHAIKLGFGYKF
jgi:opacity protein-like surface antigen